MRIQNKEELADKIFTKLREDKSVKIGNDYFEYVKSGNNDITYRVLNNEYHLTKRDLIEFISVFEKSRFIHIDTLFSGSGNDRKKYKIVAILDEFELKHQDMGFLHPTRNDKNLSCIFYNKYLSPINQPEQILSKPFILLAGISGTGKTRFVKEQAKASAQKHNLSLNENLCIVPVRPDWHEPSDLLGYISRINGTKYVATEFLKFVVKAIVHATEAVYENNIVWKDWNRVAPFWLCLDEMNLAPIEQYFADYLSILESRKWEDGKYTSEALLSSSVLQQLFYENEIEVVNPEDQTHNSFSALMDELLVGVGGKEEYKIYFKYNGIPLPPNLIVAGTVNMDETTHGFSRKVIDRALTIDFQEFFPNNFDLYFGDQKDPKVFTFPITSQVEKQDLENVKIDNDYGNSKSISFLKAINGILNQTPFQLAFRALNELLLSVTCFNPQSKEELLAVWDDFLMQKILPRIEGDIQKLKYTGDEFECKLETNKYGKPVTILHKLYSLLSEDKLSEIWDGVLRPDLLRDTEEKIKCRSKSKLEWMIKRLKTNHFTDFWV